MSEEHAASAAADPAPPAPLVADPPVARKERYHPLDPRVERLWRIQNLILTGVLLFVALVGGTLLWFLSDAPRVLPPAALLAAAALMAILAGWLPPRLRASYSYRLSDVSLEIRTGILWKRSVLIPISRVQHVDLERGPLERRFGLATLEVHTAGTSHASHEIPGLDAEVAIGLREQLAASADLVIR